MGAASVNILNSIGIKTYQDLHLVGPVEAYVRMKLRGINVSKVMLYAMQGALDDVHWNDVDSLVKKQLVSDAEAELIQEKSKTSSQSRAAI